MDINEGYMRGGSLENDLVIGIASYANYSNLSKSGGGAVLISEVQDWIQKPALLEVCFLDAIIDSATILRASVRGESEAI